MTLGQILQMKQACAEKFGIVMIISVMVNRNLFLGSDTESNDEPVVGNVSKYCVLPPSFSGKPKKGNLVFDACFESGKSFNIYSLILYSS